MNTKVIFIISLFLGLRIGTAVIGAPASKDLSGELAEPNNTVESLPEVIHPILGRLHKIPQYLRRLKIDVENELQGKIEPNNTVQSLPAVIHPILGRLHKIPQYLRRLRIDVEKELQGRIKPQLSMWPPFFAVSVEQPKTRDIQVNPQNRIEDVQPSPSVGNLKLMRILIEHVWKDAKALINKKMKGKDNEV
ncbi:uncharacterized protein LOC119550343 [Drosophila subpulchrella]|uniref:uncharacterized protein LOC119550343 n=1 Tax=Drosophila subpulchrella TaxID=1486046 RepID=UPI0018A130DB|nr:uncharacterized protein LOC119550343 [Drosophila subpulchrella]